MRSIALKLPEDLIEESGSLARHLQVSRAEYIRLAIHRMNRKTAAGLRAARLAEVSHRVRAESMNVNSEFAAIERDPDA
jgi:metal-responsive CopG/Arc/MetJ family transcriptional regulator